jgi:hypothetical protein
MHSRAARYLAGDAATRAKVVDECRGEATVPELAERILARTIYAQTASRAAPIRELLQNAIDASPKNGRVDLGLSDDGLMLTFLDRGRGMSREEILSDLLVPFRSGKAEDLESIGEHGIGFFTALEFAPHIEITTSTGTSGHRLCIAPLGDGPPYRDFSWMIHAIAPVRATGTFVRLALIRPMTRALLLSEVGSVAGLVNPELLAIFVDGVLVNTARSRLRHVARAAVEMPGTAGQLDLYVGSGQGVEPVLTIVQGGLYIAARQEPFLGPSLSLHRDIARAICASGAGLVAELSLGIPLNKGRSGVTASAAQAVDTAIVAAFERFVLEDTLYHRELLRGVDHRLAAVLDRLVQSALLNEPAPQIAFVAAPVDELATTLHPDEEAPSTAGKSVRTPTVAAPEDVVRFATALVDARLFQVTTLDIVGGATPSRISLREALAAHQRTVLRRVGEPEIPGFIYLDTSDPLSDALARRLLLQTSGADAIAAAPMTARRSIPMPRVIGAALLSMAPNVRGVGALVAAVTILERIDGAISLAAGLAPSPLSVHQDLYGPDEMAHTDGTGISINFASPRVRALLDAVLRADDVTAFSALVDLLIHEKTHVSLASYVPRAAAEHGTSFYRRKDLLRRRLLEAVDNGSVVDPIRWLPTIRGPLGAVALPDPSELAMAFTPPMAA